VAAGLLVFGAGIAAASTPIDCTSNHYALPSTVPSGSYTITGVCYGPFFTNPGDVTTLTGAAPGAGLDGQGVGSTIGIDGSTVTLQSLLVTNGLASTGGGIAAYDSANVTLSNVTISSNTASLAGGGLQLDNATVHLNGSTVSGNTAQTGAGGGAEVTDSGVLYVNNSSITGNTTQGGPGGGLSVDATGTSGSAYVTGSTIANNTAVDSGGGSYGGGVYLDGGAYVEITGSTISHNQATSSNGQSWGGGISVSDSDIYLTSSSVTANSAAYGGGIMHWGGTALLGVSLTNSNVASNVATFDGGGILNQAANGNADLWLNGTSVSFNRSLNADGGGIANYGVSSNTASVVPTGSTLTGNRALNGDGGAIANANGFPGGTATLALASTNVSSGPPYLNPNKAQLGGGIYNDGIDGPTSVSLQPHTNVVHNQASVDGGGVYNTNGGVLSIVGALILLDSPDNIS